MAPGSSQSTDGPGRFRLLASALAGRPLLVAAAGELAHTDGAVVFVRQQASIADQRREVVTQAALLGAGSLAPDIIRELRGRPKVARRYLALEGRRVLLDLVDALPPVAGMVNGAGLGRRSMTSTAGESLLLARSGAPLDEAPEWFGQIRPSLLLATPSEGAAPGRSDVRLTFHTSTLPESDEDGEHESAASMVASQSRLPPNAMGNLLSRLFGMSRQAGEGTPGGEMPTGSVRAVDEVGPNARPLEVPLPRSLARLPGPELKGASATLYPEWDEHRGQYRPEWCRVIEIPVGSAPAQAGTGVDPDAVLHRRLARLGWARQVERRRFDGDDLDVDALVRLAVDTRSGVGSDANVYQETRNRGRDLGVLILLDVSGSVTDRDRAGRSVHDHQRKAAATLVKTLEDLGDRVALYGFRSRGRSSVSLLPLKTFDMRFEGSSRRWLSALRPAGYTRLGAAIRHSGEILKREAGAPRRLLIVLSDGIPYDTGYEHDYAEADARRALAELRADGAACLCLSIGASTSTEALERVFGTAAHARAGRLGQLSGQMDMLMLDALRDLDRARARGRRTAASCNTQSAH